MVPLARDAETQAREGGLGKNGGGGRVDTSCTLSTALDMGRRLSLRIAFVLFFSGETTLALKTRTNGLSL